MNKFALFLVFAIALVLAPGSFAGDSTEEGPEIYGAEFSIDLSHRAVDVAFKYKNVRGNINKSVIHLVILTQPLFSRPVIYVVPPENIRFKGGNDEGAVPDNASTQGMTAFWAIIPEIGDAIEVRDIRAIVVYLADMHGRKAPPLPMKIESKEEV